MKKIAFIYLSNYNDWPMGGMLSYVKNLIPYFKNANWNIDYWGCSVNRKRNNNFTISNTDYTLHIYTNVKTKNKIVPNFIKSFFMVIRNHKSFGEYDIIYSHTAATSIALKILFPSKFVIHHQHGLSYVKSTGLSKLLNIGYKLAQLLTNVSFFVASPEELYEYKSQNYLFRNKKFYAIGSPINVREILQIIQRKSPHLQFVYTGRLAKWKNVDFIIDAFSKYKSEVCSDCKMIVIGDGPMHIELEQKIKQDNLSYAIFLLGNQNQEDVFKYLKSSDVFLFASNGEGVSVSILEAFAAGLPVVACDVIGVRNLVKDGQTGYLADGLNLDVYVEKMKTAVSEKDNLKKNCISFASRFDAHSLTNEIMSIINYEYENR